MHVEHANTVCTYYNGIEFAQSVTMKCEQFALYNALVPLW